jgi:hypothetical protein
MAIVCFGLFAGAMALNGFQATEAKDPLIQSVIWNTFQFGMPLLIGAMCLTGQRWAFMTAVIFGTIGLALDIATLAQSITGIPESTEFIVVIMTTGFLNFILIILGGKCLLFTKELVSVLSRKNR